MNYIDAENISMSDLKKTKIAIEKLIEEYPVDSEFRKRLEEDLWDINDVLSRDEDA